MNEKSLSFWPVFMMLTLSFGLSSHVLVLPTVLDVSGRDAWMCGIIAFAVVMPWTAVFVTGTMKRTKQIDLRQWLRKRLTPFGAWLLILPIIVLLLHTSFQTFITTTSWTSFTYLPQTPQVVVMICLMTLIGFASYSGLRAIAYLSCLLLPMVVILGDFVMSANMPYKDYAQLLPMLEHGWNKPLQGAVYAISCMTELWLLLFFQHHLSRPIKHWQLQLQLAFIALLMLGPTIGALTEFGPAEADKLLYPAFDQWRLVKIGKYIEHVDFFAIYQWLSGAVIRTSLGLTLVVELIPLRKPKARAIFILLISLLFIVTATYLLTNIRLSQALFFETAFIIELIIIIFVSTCIWLLSFTGVPKEGVLYENPKQGQDAGAAKSDNNL
ncbi:GerAB/ArcD/ProY family transporter [Paenibacillus montanisoli]|uniref:Spore gernimation protein n=1 Tax=Paenibacillus montanisoli TaxID=2081970 RepID=A0A328UBU0_9BACL|nr:GerAB/ArcD/ProY family transporter [Paenibacillus montanisoli]RAP77804.1 spore gernimation protein [Paenibacillus montanisoli]